MKINITFLLHGMPTKIEHATEVEIRVDDCDARMVAQILGAAIGEAIAYSKDPKPYTGSSRPKIGPGLK